MDNVGILEAAYHMNDSIYFTDICEELVSKSLSLAGAFYKTRDIYKFDHCRCHLFGMIHLTEFGQTLVRNGYDTHVRVDRTERVIRRFRAGFGQ